MKLEEMKQPCRKAWEKEYDYLKIHELATTVEGMYTIRNCNKTIFMECTPEAKPF